MKKAPDDNPTIGLLICSDMNKAEVQWSFKGISTPMGVAFYNNIRIKDMLPTKEQLKERMELLKRELEQVDFFSLDAIIAVGYRVSSARRYGTGN